MGSSTDSRIGLPIGAFAAAEDPAVKGIGIAGGANGVWIWERAPSSPDGAIRFAHCESTADSTWRCRRGPAVVGRISAACPMGRDVLVFFKDGTVRGFAAPRLAFGETVTATSTLQPSLPDQTLPLQVASDAKLERLFALTR